MRVNFSLQICSVSSFGWIMALAIPCMAELQPIRLSDDGRGFVLAESSERFVPWGHNYGAGPKLLEDVWESDWDTIVEDFREMKELGANVVRIHLQVSQFMEAPDRTSRKSLDRLGKLIRLAEETGLYLDITGLGCYRTTDVPIWYDRLSTTDRWIVQARFWQAVAEVASNSPAIFCYDLMNEPVVPGDKRGPGQWYSGKPFGGYDFVQFIEVDPAERPRHEIAREWIRTLTKAIRSRDKSHLITVGMLPSTKEWGHFSGFVPEKLASELDFISVHIYPKSGKLDEAITVLKQFSAGKPLVIEETFNLTCSEAELREFLLASRGTACGWIGHYGGETIADLHALEQSGRLTMPQAFMRNWLELFQDLRSEMTVPAPKTE